MGDHDLDDLEHARDHDDGGDDCGLFHQCAPECSCLSCVSQ